VLIMFKQVMAATLALLGSIDLYAQPIAQNLPRFNYWDLCAQLIKEDALVSTLEVSPLQLQRLRFLLKRLDLEERIAATARELEDTNNPNGDILALARSVHDDDVKSELRKVIDGKQITAMLVLAVRARYPSGLAPFFDKEVLRICIPTEIDRDTLQLHLDLRSQSYKRDASQLLAEAASSVLDGLRPEAKELFVVYAGNKYLPKVKVVEDFNVAIPYPLEFKSIARIENCLSSRETCMRLGISAREQEAATAVIDEFMPSFDKFDVQRHAYKSFREYVFASLDAGNKGIEKVLSRRSMSLLARMQASEEFETDFRRPFIREGFVTFLGLSPAEVVDIKVLAALEHRKVVEGMADLNARTFALICSVLSSDSRLRLATIFQDIWKINDWEK